MIKNINIPAGAGSPKSRKSSADIGKPALHNCGMILIVLWDGRPARRRVFSQQAGHPTRIILKLCNAGKPAPPGSDNYSDRT
ncbi:hypothetical protein E5S67_00809 [Microcoleus sp. IPMA8]|uniref:Transposase n=1 Tax=Microcoleus asticus IPMA8 TaxID=2563858 RepID=A0ABX2CTS1_9CYAN|nr:hypothetical protein [Microcoleus asticus IPMA8]